jgi:HD-GYP domain-containing protein (c-di-GMP phosphodiesterase class II)
LSPEVAVSLGADGKSSVVCVGEGLYRLTTVLFDDGRPILVAESVLTGAGGADRATEQGRLQRWLQAVSDRIHLTEQAAAQRQAEDEQDVQLKRAWNVVLALDESLRHVKAHRDLGRQRPKLLQTIHALLDCQAVAWVPGSNGGAPVLHGEAILSSSDCAKFARLLAQIAGEPRIGSPILWNQGPWATHFPAVRNLLAVPLSEAPRGGWLLALNKLATGFRRADAAALLPFASLFDLQSRTYRRVRELKELLVGLTRALTSAIDAKDAYTFGHSERVARIGLELGRQLRMTEDEQSDIYLAGLLHDIGKIGIRDAVLTKPTPLTAEELAHIKEHPMIGYRILADLTPLRSLLPGVRNHHERWDGKGYPDGLAGEDIPLVARILAVADAYDAMMTRRPYRDGLSVAEVEKRLREGAGTQWDSWVIEAFLRCQSEIHRVRQRGLGESLNRALDRALRTEGSSTIFPALPEQRAPQRIE